MQNSRKGFAFSLAGTALLSTNFISAKIGLQNFNLETFCFLWSLFAFMFSAIMVVSSGQVKSLILPSGSRNGVLLLGFTTGIGMVLTWAGLEKLDPLFASFIWKFAPVFTILMGVVYLNEKLEKAEVFCLLVMVSGGLISAFGKWNVVGTGLLLTLGACLISAVPMVIAKAQIKTVPPIVLVFYRTFIAFLVISAWVLYTNKLVFSSSFSQWVIVLLGAFIGPTLSFVLIFKSYTFWDLSHSTIVSTVDSLFVLPLAYMFFGKIAGGNQLAGGIIILFGAFWFLWLHFNTRISQNGK